MQDKGLQDSVCKKASPPHTFVAPTLGTGTGTGTGTDTGAAAQA